MARLRSHRLKIAALAALLIGGSVAEAWTHGSPVVYYVSTSGSDSNNGTSPATPFQTISHINGLTINNATRVLFNGGQTFTGAVALTTSNVSAAVTLASYGTGQATISSGSAACITATNLGNITATNLTCTGGGQNTNTTDGVHIENSQSGNTKLQNITLNNLNISQYGYNGVNILGSAGTSGFNNVSILSVVAHDNSGVGTSGTGGIIVQSSTGYGSGNTAPAHTNVTIEYNTVYNNTGHTGNTNWVGSGIFVGETKGATVEFNIAHNNGANNNVGAGPVGIWTGDSGTVTIAFNESYNNLSQTFDGGGFDCDGGTFNCLIEYNYSHGNYGPGYLVDVYNDGTVTTSSGVTVRYNISENDMQGGTADNIANFEISLNSNTITNLFIYNNTIYGSTANPLFLQGAGTYATAANFANNILYASGSATFVQANGTPSGLNYTGNDYYTAGSFSIAWGGTTYTSFASWQTATGQEKISGSNVGLTSNPSLTSPGSGGTVNGYQPPAPTAYHLQHGSAMIGAGLNLSTQFSISPGTIDYYGDPIPNGGAGTGYNVGADGANR